MAFLSGWYGFRGAVVCEVRFSVVYLRARLGSSQTKSRCPTPSVSTILPRTDEQIVKGIEILGKLTHEWDWRVIKMKVMAFNARPDERVFRSLQSVA